jgi:hypothetical protein
MVHRVQVREISNDEGNRLLRIVRRSSGSVVTWRRAQMVLLSAQGMDPAGIAEVTFTSPDRVRDVLHSFNADGFDSLKPKSGPEPVWWTPDGVRSLPPRARETGGHRRRGHASIERRAGSYQATRHRRNPAGPTSLDKPPAATVGAKKGANPAGQLACLH